MIDAVMASYQDRILCRENLARHTYFRVGGPADYLYLPAGRGDLVNFLQNLPLSVPVTWLGLGSNVLIRDRGIRGVVIVTQGALREMAEVMPLTVRAEAGVSCAALARFTARLGLGGLEFMAGIPGTVGGALAMNAGCHGGETWQHVLRVETVDRRGNTFLREAHQFVPGYRHVLRPAEEWFLAGYFSLVHGEREKSLANIRSLLARRNETQPTGLPNCGSVFRNPPGDYAARLIESCGLKNFSIGGASVSAKHANFIINNGNASAAEIEQLVRLIQERVFDRHGIALQPEVCMLGE